MQTSNVVILLLLFVCLVLADDKVKQNGMSYVTSSNGMFSLPTSILDQKSIYQSNANSIAIVFSWYQQLLNSTSIAASDTYSPAQHDLDTAMNVHLQQATSKFLLLKPHVDVFSGDWRGFIGQQFTTELQWQQWFASYTTYMTHYLEYMIPFANKYSAVQFVYCVGTELKSTSNRTSDWLRVIQQLKARTIPPNVKFVYASNWDEYDHVAWWNELDYIGVDGYFPLPAKNISVAAISQEWYTIFVLNYVYRTPWYNSLQAIHTKFNKNILFTEIGYCSAEGARNQPWLRYVLLVI